MNNCSSILVIDDEPMMYEALSNLLEPEYVVHPAYSGQEGLEKIDAVEPDLVLLDLRMPQMNGISFLKKFKQLGKDIPVIVLTAYGNVNSAVQMIKLGAVDYIEKPFDNQKLKQTVRAFIPKRMTVKELPIRQGIVGRSPQLQKVWRLIEKYGPTDLPVAIYGETGTGKELFAKAIHEISKRSQEPFVATDCSTLPESLVESELFGYEKGAFTGANGSKAGRLEWANGGTIFLDEISNIPLSYQAKLLRVLQEQEFAPLGAKVAKFLDVRVVSASNVDLIEAIQHGTFREDLYYRVSGLVIDIPPLREREGDIELLSRHFVDKYGKKYDKPNLEISNKAMELLSSYWWPGNVRELEHVICRAVIMADRVILSEHLLQCTERKVAKPNGEKPSTANNGMSGIELKVKLTCDITNPVDLKEIRNEVASEAERQLIDGVKKRLSLNQTELAEFLGIDSKTLRSKQRKYDTHCR